MVQVIGGGPPEYDGIDQTIVRRKRIMRHAASNPWPLLTACLQELAQDSDTSYSVLHAQVRFVV